MTRLAAYTSYAVGSCIFLAVALARGSTLVAVGSVLFLAGTLLLVVPEARWTRRTSGARRARR